MRRSDFVSQKDRYSPKRENLTKNVTFFIELIINLVLNGEQKGHGRVILRGIYGPEGGYLANVVACIMDDAYHII